jgi:23S rRNA pseudouridine1911/1915/1917 synthase
VRDKDAEKNAGYVRPRSVDPEATLTVVRVPREWVKWRLDRVVVQTFPRMSRTRAQFVVKTGAYTPEGRKLRSNDRVRENDVILLWRPPFEEPDVPLECPIVYEDERLLAIDKPPGLPVHPTARYIHKTVTAVMAAQRPGEFLALCHRIDRETSGVLLLAKDLEAERFIKKVLEEKQNPESGVHKRYLALTWGIPEPRKGRITHALKLSENHRVKMRIADGDPEALWAATRYEVREAVVGRRSSLVGGEKERETEQAYALVQCDLETGRQHQIRAHLSAIGAPIVGDKLYGPDEELIARGADEILTEEDHALLELPRHALHAHRLVIPHPSGGSAEIVAPLPKDLQEFWDRKAVSVSHRRPTTDDR